MAKNKSKKTSPVVDASRREFIKTSAVGLAGLAITGCTTTGLSDRSPASLGDIQVGSDEQFEYIVVGSGAGGGPLAANLANRGHKVLLIEAGGNNKNIDAQIPAYHALSTEDPAMSWNYFVNHYPDQARAAKDSKYIPGKGIWYPRAATIGGCTAHNAMITMYPDNRDFDKIAQSTGDHSWNSREMRRHFMNLERNHYYHRGGLNLSQQGFDGWLDTNRPNLNLALKDYDLRAVISSTVGEQNLVGDVLNRIVAEAGNFPPDPNKWQYALGKSNGFFNVPLSTTADGKRGGPREYILETIEKQRGKSKDKQFLQLKTHALAKRILFSPQDPSRAIGIEYYDSAHAYSADPAFNAAATAAAPIRQVFATREVILAGGAFNSPQLLMLSGIGDPAELARVGVQGPYIPLPGVGKNLQDRYEVGVVSELSHDFNILKNCDLGAASDPCLKDYQVDPNNSIYSTNGVVISLIRRSNWGKEDPDICVFGIPGHFAGYYPGWSKNAFKRNQFTWAILKGHTNNTAGTVGLKSANAFDTPEINFNYFDTGNGNFNEDIDGVIEGLRIARRMNETLTGRGILRTELSPGPDVLDQHGGLKKYIMQEAWGHHASCSNKMGTSPDGAEQAVVDSHFRVHKTKGLRIVDASVFPKVPGLFISLPIYMIADKAAETIVNDIRS